MRNTGSGDGMDLEIQAAKDVKACHSEQKKKREDKKQEKNK